jgi:hypothetical protein
MTLTETAISDHIGGIETDGYSILEDAIEPELVEQLLTTVRRVEAELDVQPKATLAEGHATLRMYNLLAKDPAFQAMPLHPNVLPSSACSTAGASSRA